MVSLAAMFCLVYYLTMLQMMSSTDLLSMRNGRVYKLRFKLLVIVKEWESETR